jgi:hypothetical protein
MDGIAGALLGMAGELGIAAQAAPDRPLPPRKPATLGEALLRFREALMHHPRVVSVLAKAYEVDGPGTWAWRVMVVTEGKMTLGDDSVLLHASMDLMRSGWMVNVWTRPRSWAEENLRSVKMRVLYRRADPTTVPEWLLKLVPEMETAGQVPTEAEIDNEQLGWATTPNPRGPGE